MEGRESEGIEKGSRSMVLLGLGVTQKNMMFLFCPENPYSLHNFFCTS